MNAIFTIVAKNYTGLAQVLEASVRKNTDADFFIFIADEWKGHESLKLSLPANVITAKDVLNISSLEWDKMSFKYNLVEFCTSIKAACFQYLFTKGFDKLIFFDPDVYVFNPLDSVFNLLNDVSFVVTPHILNTQTPFKGDYPDYLFLLNGTFNLGFLGVKKSAVSVEFLKWWHHRLVEHCFFDNDSGTATDQKWINLLPSLLPANEYVITRDPGMNVAPWNFHERHIIDENGVLFVKNRDDYSSEKTPLLFAHFSSYNYSLFCDGQTIHKTTKIIEYPDLQPIFDAYAVALSQSQFKTFSTLTYSYGSFDNGIGILSLHRRMYRRLLEEKVEYKQLFSTGVSSYFDLLKTKGLLDYSPVSPDKLTNKSVKDFGKKFRYLNQIFILLKNLMGIRRYSIMIRFFRRYFAEENQAFLVNKEAITKLKS